MPPYFKLYGANDPYTPGHASGCRKGCVMYKEFVCWTQLLESLADMKINWWKTYPTIYIIRQFPNL